MFYYPQLNYVMWKDKKKTKMMKFCYVAHFKLCKIKMWKHINCVLFNFKLKMF